MCCRLAADVEGIGRFGLHAEGQFEGLNAGLERGVAAARLACSALSSLQQVELPPLHPGRGMRAADVLDQLVDLSMLRIDERALKSAGQKAGLPVLGVLDRHGRRGTWRRSRAGSDSPRPGRRVTQAPTLGRACTQSPQFISMSDGSWFGTWAYIERITARRRRASPSWRIIR